MIKNPTELVIFIEKCEIDISRLERKKNLHPYRNNYSLLKELAEKQHVLKKRIWSAIAFYKDSTKEYYLDQVVFGDVIRHIEESYCRTFHQSEIPFKQLGESGTVNTSI